MAGVYQTPGAAAPVEGKIKIFLALFRCSYFSLWYETSQFTILTSFNHTELYILYFSAGNSLDL